MHPELKQLCSDDEDLITALVKNAIDSSGEMLQKSDETKKHLMGVTMKALSGRANPHTVSRIIDSFF